MQCDYCRYTDIGGREENEDSIEVLPYGNNLVAVVADGLGGQGDGKDASQLVCGDLINCGEDGVFPSADTIKKAFERANENLMRRQRNAYHMKTTAVYFCLHKNNAVWAHVGDSRLYHIYDGRLCHYTLDHSASQLAVFLGELKREDIPKDADRSRLIRAMGVEDVSPDVYGPIELEPGGQHVFILCSDGFWEYISDDEFEKVCAQSTDSEQCLKRLWKIKRSRSSADCDNNSAIVIYVRE